jgi:hypothetical protein
MPDDVEGAVPAPSEHERERLSPLVRLQITRQRLRRHNKQMEEFLKEWEVDVMKAEKKRGSPDGG